VTIRYLLAVVMLTGAFLQSTARSADGGKTVAEAGRGAEGATLEERLLEDLATDPSDKDVHRELFAPAEGSSGMKDGAKQPPEIDSLEELQERLLRELGAQSVSEEQSPLVEVARQMRFAEQRIAQSDSGPGTQALQQDIITRLEELLKQARSRCSGGKPAQNQPQQVAARRPIDQPKRQQEAEPKQGGQKPSDKPVRNPETRAGSSTPQRPDMDQMRDLLKDVWGELPPGEREQMLELPVEEFLPKYELLIEAYFKRLAEQKEAERWPAESVPPR